MVCASCGVVGAAASGRYLFDGAPSLRPPEAALEIGGSISRCNRPLAELSFAPEGAWREASGANWSDTPAASCRFRTDAISVGIIFLRHPWSGIVRIKIDGVDTVCIDLFEEAGTMQFWQPLYLGGGTHDVEIVVDGDAHGRSKGAQVFVKGIETLEHTRVAPASLSYDAVNRGNPYPAPFEKLLCQAPEDSLILDCGSGDRSHPDPRVVSFEYSRFHAPDVFGDGHQLPFRDDSFDLILSQAVIEHLYDPYAAAKEIVRVLKPGGVLYVESAFMQPLHAVPFHFFNTTGWALERLFADLEEVHIGYEGVLSSTLDWFYRLTSLRSRGLGARVDELLSIARELDSHISAEELKSFASYVTLVGRKPGAR